MSPFSDYLATLRFRHDAWRLGRTSGPDASVIASALSAARAETLSTEERDWVDRIEELRHVLLTCNDEISKTDHGAGTRRTRRGEADAYRGVVSTTTVARACRASKPRMWGLFLFGLVRRLRPRCCLELGTCLGISSAYQAAAQRLNGGGSLITLEGDPALATLAAEHLRRLGLADVRLVRGRFQDTLRGVLDEHGPVDHAFIDGHHDGDATLAYFDLILPRLTRRAVVVFDDISWPAMRPAWRAIARHEQVRLASRLGSIGVCRVA